MGVLKAKSYNDFSKGNWQSVSASSVPENSVELALNMDSDRILGSLLIRGGSSLVNAQILAGKTVLGLHNFRDNLGNGDKLFAVVSDGTNSDIYDVITGLKSLEDDTKDLDTNFLTYLGSSLRLNGTDVPKSWNGTAWESINGAFDVANLPTGSKGAIEFKDQVYVYGRTDSPDRLDKSSIADPVTKTISWTVGTGLGFIIPEQEDGGGGITGLAKVPGYLLIFKRRTLKRFDGTSTFPEDLVSVGAPSQKAIVMAAGLVFFMNENDAWVTAGGAPKGIGSFMVRDIVKSVSAADMLKVCGGSDEEHVFFSIPSCTMSGETYTNVVLKYNILQNTWDIRQYPTFITSFSKTLDTSGEVYVTYGNNDGSVFVLDAGTSDGGKSISWSVQTHDLEFGQRMFKKEIERMGVITEGVSTGMALYRTSHKPEEWTSLGKIDTETKDLNGLKLKGNYFNFKFTGKSETGGVEFISIEFPAGIKVYSNTD